MLILYLAILCSGLYFVIKNLLPEMSKPVAVKPQAPKPIEQEIVNEDPAPENRILKLKGLLAEKNSNIQVLQTHIKAMQIQIRDFDKVRSLLEDEIHHLREQNRIFRSELGLPAVDVKEKQVA